MGPHLLLSPEFLLPSLGIFPFSGCNGEDAIHRSCTLHALVQSTCKAQMGIGEDEIARRRLVEVSAANGSKLHRCLLKLSDGYVDILPCRLDALDDGPDMFLMPTAHFLFTALNRSRVELLLDGFGGHGTVFKLRGA